MLSRWDLLKLRLRYGHLGKADAADLLRSTLRDPDGGDHRNLRELILEVAFLLRPTFGGPDGCPPDDMRWKYWVSMVLRYFPSLVQSGGRSNTIANVQSHLERNRALCQLLLFGELDRIISILPTLAASNSALDTLQLPTSEQAIILDIIRYHVQNKTISERQIANWTTAMLEEWAEALNRRLQIPFIASFSHLLRDFLLRTAGSTEAVDPTTFDDLMKQFRNIGLDWAYGMALGYRNEIKRRYRAMERSAFWVAIGGILSALSLAVFIAIRMVAAASSFQLLPVLFTGLAFALVLLHLARLMVLMLRINSTLETQIATLREIEALFASGEDDPSGPETPSPSRSRIQRAR